MNDSNWGGMYRRIGVEPVINAIGNVSILGGSTASPAVREAMEAASDAYAPLLTVAEAAGAEIAGMLGVEAAWVTSGAGSAITLSTAACMAGDDPTRIARLPDTAGMPNEFVIQKRQRYSYDRCLELAGGVIVEAGSAPPVDRAVRGAAGSGHGAGKAGVPGTTEDDLASAIGPNTAAVHYVADERVVDPNVLTFEQVLNIAHDRHVPVIVDAAGQVYPTENLNKYARAGADLVCYGAKYIRAPHSTGFLAGSKEMVHRASRNSFVAFESLRLRSLGRPHKVDRQEMIGVVVALQQWLTMNHEERFAKYDDRIEAISRRLGGVRGLSVTPQRQTVGGSSYGVVLDLDAGVAGTSLEDLVDVLKSGDPPIWTRVVGGRMLLAVNELHDGEAETVGDSIARALASA